MPDIVFLNPDGSERIRARAEPGESLLHLAQRIGIPLEGACESNMACSTCHLYVEKQGAAPLQAPSDDEEDMLDMTFGVTAASRLSCQVILRTEDDGLTVRLPAQHRSRL